MKFGFVKYIINGPYCIHEQQFFIFIFKKELYNIDLIMDKQDYPGSFIIHPILPI